MARENPVFRLVMVFKSSSNRVSQLVVMSAPTRPRTIPAPRSTPAIRHGVTTILQATVLQTVAFLPSAAKVLAGTCMP